MRFYPALDLDWPVRPDDEFVDLLIAEIDEERPTAVIERERGVRVFFSSADSRRRAAVHVHAFDPPVACVSVDVPDEDWAERSQADLQPVTVGRLTIAPKAGKRTSGVLFIRPSMGFGTGHHASTRLCLRLLQRISLGGRRVLDVGTGSGVLAIAASRLGAESALGIDHDPDALVAAQESVDRNGESTKVTLAAIDLARDAIAGSPFDVLLANLTGALLVREATRLAALIAPGGHLIASGFMTDEDAMIDRAFSGTGLYSVDRLEEDGWVGRLFTSPSAPTMPPGPPSAPVRL